MSQLRTSLADNTSLAEVVRSLSIILWVVAAVGSALLVFGSDLQQVVLPSLTVMLSLSFIFGNRYV